MIEENTRTDVLERSLIDVAVEGWRLARSFARVVNRLDAGEQRRHAGQLRYFEKQIQGHLEVAGFSVVSIEGLPFDPGAAASAINLGEFGPEDQLLVDQMLEPIVLGPTGVRRQGTVTVRKALV
jgi:hypothetical protein